MSETAELLAAHVECGRHAGIPSCCVAEFVADLAAGIDEVGLRRAQEFGGGKLNLPSVGYVPCRACYRGLLDGTVLPVWVHQCDPTDEECLRIQALYDAAYYRSGAVGSAGSGVPSHFTPSSRSTRTSDQRDPASAVTT